MKHSLSKRLFGITLSLIIGLMLLTYFAESTLFERFYSYKKTNSLINEVGKFRDLYSLHIDNDIDLYQVLQKFENDNNAQIVITSLNRHIIYQSRKIQGDSDSFNFCSELIIMMT